MSKIILIIPLGASEPSRHDVARAEIVIHETETGYRLVKARPSFDAWSLVVHDTKSREKSFLQRMQEAGVL